MENPILMQLNRQGNSQNNLPIQQIKNLMQQMKAAKNPQLMLQNLLQNNPQLQLLLKNNSPQQVAQLLAQQKGIDLNSLIQQLQS